MKLFKFLRLPTPIETGKSKYNCLPIDMLGVESENYTWEKHYLEMKKKYPIRYFLNETIPKYCRKKISRPLDNFKYWIISHTIRKYHLLDMRNVENKYLYGYIEPEMQFLYALMAILNNFIAAQDTTNRILFLEYEAKNYNNIHNYNFQEEIDFCKELLSIQRWWKIERPKTFDVEFDNMDEQHIWDQKCKEKDDQMMKRLIDLRGKMWT